MMNHQNYEAWFLDYLEGNLSDKQLAVLELFLAQNPNLKIELEEMELLKLPIDQSLTFLGKDALKKQVPKKIAIDKIDNLLIGQLENTLSVKESAELKQAIRQNPNLLKDQKIYQLTILKPDLQVQYPNKKELKRNDKKLIPLRYLIQTAAMITILVSVFFLLNKEKKTTPSIVQVPIESPTKKITPTTKTIIQPDQITAIPADLSEEKGNQSVQNLKENTNNQQPRHIFAPQKKEVVSLLPTDFKKQKPTPPEPENKLAHQPVKLDTIRKTQKNKPETTKTEGQLAINQVPKNKTTSINTTSSTQPKSLALAAIDYGLKKLSKEEQDHNSIPEALISSAEILSNKKLKIKRTENKDRKKFSVSIGKFGFSRSKSRS